MHSLRDGRKSVTHFGLLDSPTHAGEGGRAMHNLFQKRAPNGANRKEKEVRTEM